MENSLAFAPCQNHIEFSSQTTFRHLSDDALEAVLVPLDDLGGVDLVGSANPGLAAPAAGDTLTGTGPRCLSASGAGIFQVQTSLT